VIRARTFKRKVNKHRFGSEVLKSFREVFLKRVRLRLQERTQGYLATKLIRDRLKTLFIRRSLSGYPDSKKHLHVQYKEKEKPLLKREKQDPQEGLKLMVNSKLP
jgi:hypothetical protein